MHEHEPAAIMPAGSASMIRNLRTPGVQVIGRASVARIVEARKIRHERVMIAQSPTRILNRTSKSSCEQQDGSGIEEGCCRLERSFEVLGEAAVAPEPGQEAYAPPAPGMHGKADLASLLAHDLDDDSGRGRHSVGGIGAIGEDPLDEGVQRARSLQQGNGAIAILDRGRMDLEYQ